MHEFQNVVVFDFYLFCFNKHFSCKFVWRFYKNVLLKQKADMIMFCNWIWDDLVYIFSASIDELTSWKKYFIIFFFKCTCLMTVLFYVMFLLHFFPCLNVI